MNLAATGAVGMGAAITKEWLLRECEAHGIELPRVKKGEHAGEVRSTVTMDVMKSKISEHDGGSLVEMVTDEDGDVKGVYDWLGSGSSGGGGGGNTEVHVGATEEPAARQLRRRDGVQRGSVVAVAMEVAAAPPPGSPQRRVGGTHPRAAAPAEASPQGNRQRRRLEKRAERGASGGGDVYRRGYTARPAAEAPGVESAGLGRSMPICL